MIGLCKAAKLDGEDGIIDQDYSLNAGRYVGVVIEDDGMTEEEFRETMLGLNRELTELNNEAKELEAQISENIKALFGERGWLGLQFIDWEIYAIAFRVEKA